MKGALILFFTVLLTTSLYADPFADFRVPKHTVCNLNGTLAGSYTGYHTNRGTYFQTNDRGTGNLSIAAMRLYDSDPLRAYLNVSLSANGSLEKYRTKSEYDPTNYAISNSDYGSGNESWSLAGSTRAYPWAVALGAFADLTAHASYDQFRGKTFAEAANGYTFNQDDGLTKRWIYDYSVSGSIGLGYGRVRDASAVYTVYVIEQRLKESGAVTRDLSTATREKLASLLYSQKDFNSVYDRPSRRFWQDVEKILREDGALRAEGLDAYDSYRITEPLIGSSTANRGRVTYLSAYVRNKGYFVGLAMSGSTYNSIFREQATHDQTTALLDSMEQADHSHSDVFTRNQSFSDYVAFGPQAEYHLPWGMRWQFDVLTSVMFPQHRGPSAFIANSRATAVYLITDRWYARANVVHNRQITDDIRQHYYSNNWAVQSSAELHYYVEDRADVFLTLSQTQQRSDGTQQLYGTIGPQFDRNTAVSLGLSYHFRGRFTAPDLGIASGLPSMVWPWQR